MLRKIKLYGHLREHTGLKEVEAYVDSVKEAVNFLTCNWPKLKPQIVQNNYHVLLDEDDIGEEELLYPVGNATISFIPVVEGSGKFGRILAGVALIGLAVAAHGAGFAFGKEGIGFMAVGANPSTFMAAVGNIGVYLVLSGVASLLTPTPSTPEQEQTPESFAFTSPLNVSMPGIAVPLVYGTAICGSIVVSTSIEIGKV
jgi:predicted phage tail protein